MATVYSKAAFNFLSAFILVNALVVSPAAIADCSGLLLRSSSQISQPIYDQALNQPLPVSGAMPEEVLAFLGSFGNGSELWQAISELGIQQVRLGAKFKISHYSKTLTVQRSDFHKPEAQADAAIALARVLYLEKQKQLRFRINPNAYIQESLDYAAVLERFAMPVIQRSAPQLAPEMQKSFGFFSYSLRTLLGMPSSRSAAWPKSKTQAAFQFTISRLVTAMYMSLIAITAVHVPDAYGTLATVFKLRADLAEMGKKLEEGIEFDGRQLRLEMIERYSHKIKKLQIELNDGESANPEEIKAKIQKLEDIKKSLEDEVRGL